MRSAGTRRPLLLLLEVAEPDEGLVKKKYRMAKTDMTANTSSEGMFRVVGSDGEDDFDIIGLRCTRKVLGEFRMLDGSDVWYGADRVSSGSMSP